MKYRSDIDGLRALAIVPVVFYHVGVPLFPGGYVGVDIFFVISGYLITGLIAEEVKQGSFSILAFYERRVRRIFPALIVVLLFTTLIGAAVMIPQRFFDFGRSLMATVLFASNILFWLQVNYFDTYSAEKPLLHTWSLAVEEQFYIVFPLILFIVHRWLRERWLPWIGGIAVASFALSAYAINRWPDATFYLAPHRAWELMIGALLALDVVPAASRRGPREAAAATGFALIIYAVTCFSRATTFPGPSALVPCIGAALLIYAGRCGSTLLSQALSWRPVVHIGLISYSLYLWHWPLIVFAKTLAIDDLSIAARIGIVALSGAAAELSLRYVEQPFRRRKGVLPRYQLFAGATAAMACIAALGTLVYLSHGWPGRLPKQVTAFGAFETSIDGREKACLSSKDREVPPSQLCVYGADVTPAFALWGDSHAGAIAASIGDEARRNGSSFVFIGHSGCPPVMGLRRTNDPKCVDHNARAMNFLTTASNIKTVIIVSRYAVNLYGGTFDFGPAEEDRERTPLLADAEGNALSVRDAEATFAKAMRATVDQLEAAGKTVVLVYPIPETGYDIPKTLATIALEGGDPKRFDRDETYYLHRQRFVFGVLDAVGNPARTMRVYPDKLICSNGRCAVSLNDESLYRDDDHLSLAGGRLLEPLFDPVFAIGRTTLGSQP